MSRGIRTLDEVAHFVRQIVIMNDSGDGDLDNVWSTPDVLITMRQGQIHDHALLMASMFRAVKYEQLEDLKKAFVKSQERYYQRDGKRLIKVVKKANIDEDIDSVSDDDDDRQSNSDGHSDDADDDEFDEDKDSSDYSAGNASNDDDNDSDADSDASGDDRHKDSEEDGDGQEPEGSDTIEDRVFVCVGRFKRTKKQAVWVMTIDRDFQVVTLWNPV